MSDVQKEATSAFTSNRGYVALKKIFDRLPDRFTTKQAQTLSGLTGQYQMVLVVHSLQSCFRCHRTAKGVWVKPEKTASA
jgi:hypothetical protein